MELTIVRHCVPADPVTGLSPLQAWLLDESCRVRLASAPTGAGKSYAFQRLLMQDPDARVLFIVPTRRLAQNLAASLARDLVREAGWPVDLAESKVAIWSSDQSSELRDAGEASIGGYRLRQLQGLRPTRDGGEMIFAIPEVVSHLLLGRRVEAGHAALGVFDFLDAFDHIVFDECHSIEPRGFGLAALFARLVTVAREDGGDGYGRAKVSFLSATPLALRPVLEKLGIPPQAIAEREETIGTDGRPLHGDVHLGLRTEARLVDLMYAERDAVAREIAAGRQAVAIYDRLGSLRRELPDLAHLVNALGLPPQRVLVINSIDDSGGETAGSAGFHTGRRRNPDDYDLLVATASVELGVTFRAANLLFMEPGFSPLAFLQRYGRAARRGADGMVWVRIEDRHSHNEHWMRSIIERVRTKAGTRVGIAELTGWLSDGAKAKNLLPSPRVDDGPRYFGSLSQRAVYTAGLYWYALMQHPSNRGPRRNHLLVQAPPSERLVFGLLERIRALSEDPLVRNVAQKWCERFEHQACTLRDIGPRLRVIEGDGRTVEVEKLWLRRETSVFEHRITTVAPDGRDEIRLDGELDDYLLDETERRRATREVRTYFPHTAQCLPLRAWPAHALIDHWCLALNDRLPYSGFWKQYPEAREAAERLVRLTGLVPCDDDSVPVDAVSGVL